MNKPELVDCLAAWLVERPEDAREFLEVIASSLARYEERQAAMRGVLATRAVLDLMALSRFPPQAGNRIPYWLSFMMHQFPGGVTIHSPVEKAYWAEFIEIARAEPVDVAWLRDVAGEQAWRWWHAHVDPVISGARDG